MAKIKSRAASVEFRNVTKIYAGDARAVDDISLKVEAGELVTLLGPSGCGKTTTLRMIAGLEPATMGAILIGETDVTALPAVRCAASAGGLPASLLGAVAPRLPDPVRIATVRVGARGERHRDEERGQAEEEPPSEAGAAHHPSCFRVIIQILAPRYTADARARMPIPA